MFKRKDNDLWEEVLRELNGQPLNPPKYFYGKTQAVVKRKINEYKGKVERGILFPDAVDEWEERKAPTVTPKTAEGYRAPAKRIKAAFAGVYAKDITPAQVKSFIDDLAAKGYAKDTVQKTLNVLNMVFRYIITLPGSVVKYNPCDAVKVPRGLKQETRDLADREDIEKIKSSAHLPFGLYPLIMMWTGLRDQEVLALQFSDFDFKADTISVTKGITWRNNKVFIKDTKTEAGKRKVPILAPLKTALPKKWPGYLFSADGGKSPLTQTQYRHRWQTYCKAAGLADPIVTVREEKVKSNLKNNPGEITRTYKTTKWIYHLTPYQLRHEFASLCLDAELDPKDLQDLMGHASPETAQRIYAHIKESRRKKTTKKLAEYVQEM